MPCNDGGVPYPPSRAETLEAKVPAPILCALMRKGLITDTMLDEVDWKESGVTRGEFYEWWAQHIKFDERRQQLEAANVAATQQREQKQLEDLIKKFPVTARRIVGSGL